MRNRKKCARLFGCVVTELSVVICKSVPGDILSGISKETAWLLSTATAHLEPLIHTHTQVGQWDLLIAHPPCTYLSNAGAARLYKVIDGKTYINRERFEKGMDAREFFFMFLKADCDKIAIENPVPSGVYRLPKYNQVIQPYEYGEPYSKKTCLWLKGLPELNPTDIVKPICSWVSGGSKKADGSPRENKGTVYRDSKTKSKTFHNIAKAMAEQWG